MQKLRSHIIRILAVSFIWAGFGLYITQPVQAKSSTQSFAYWFSQLAQQESSAEFAKELDSMKNAGVDLAELIGYASQIVSEHNEGFNIPLKGASGSHQIYQVLLAQWSQYQTGSGMAKVPPPDAVKSGMTLKIDKFGSFGSGILAGGTDKLFLNCETGIITPCLHVASKVVPMITGIAIGAP